MSKFHNPYHFVPVSKTIAPGGVPLPKGEQRDETFSRSLAHRSHDRYSPGSRCGRIICRLTTQSPLVVGATQTKGRNGAGSVDQFTFGDEPAIPASTLRGLISSVAEAASNSALRVLEARWNNAETAYCPGQTAKVSGNAVEQFARISPDLLPLGKHQQKNILTIAELVFGFVEERANSDQEGDPALAFASRLRFAHALPSVEVRREGRLVLKELSGPKPPRATFYFQPGDSGGSITSKLPGANDAPKGRKFYLPHDPARPAAVNRPDWKAQNQTPTHDRQLGVDAIASGTVFWFHLDFDNLDEAELNLLCYALDPTPSYRHRLGLGKPLGLGLCKIEVAGLFLVERDTRYTPPNPQTDWLAELRYQFAARETWISANTDPRHRAERSAAGFADTLTPRQRANTFKANAHPAHQPILRALEMLGDLTSLQAPVHYPTRNPANLETDLYEWFSQGPNDYLYPLPGATSHLPLLDTLMKNPPSPKDLEGTEQNARVVLIRPNGNPELEVDHCSKPIAGALQNPQRFKMLNSRPTQIRVRVLRYDERQKRFQLEMI